MPFRGGIFREQTLDLVEKSWRCFVPREQAQTSATCAFPLARRSRQLTEEYLPGAHLTLMHDRLRTLRIVEFEQLRLHENVSRSEAGGMFCIAFDFRGAAFVRFHKHAARVAPERECAGVVERLAGNQFFRLTHIGHDAFARLSGTAGRTGERNRRAHQFEKISSTQFVRPIGRARNEFIEMS